MKLSRHALTVFSLLMFWTVAATATVSAQTDAPSLVAAGELARIVPPGFYFEGQSAPTQMRNATAARFGTKRHVIAGMVDTSGYAADVRAKYEGFFITDSPIAVGTGVLGVGAYGFGFTESGQFNIFDVGGNPLMTVQTTNDPAQARPRPLMMTLTREGLRLSSGRRYVVIAARPKEVEL